MLFHTHNIIDYLYRGIIERISNELGILVSNKKRTSVFTDHPGISGVRVVHGRNYGNCHARKIRMRNSTSRSDAPSLSRKP